MCQLIGCFKLYIFSVYSSYYTLNSGSQRHFLFYLSGKAETKSGSPTITSICIFISFSTFTFYTAQSRLNLVNLVLSYFVTRLSSLETLHVE